MCLLSIVSLNCAFTAAENDACLKTLAPGEVAGLKEGSTALAVLSNSQCLGLGHGSCKQRGQNITLLSQTMMGILDIQHDYRLVICSTVTPFVILAFYWLRLV